MDKINKHIAETKTLCCNADWYRKSRANFRCKKCEKDVTLEIIFLYKALTIPDVIKSLPQDNYCKVCNLPTDGEKCYSNRCPI
jgi:hypothetical protein